MGEGPHSQGDAALTPARASCTNESAPYGDKFHGLRPVPAVFCRFNLPEARLHSATQIAQRRCLVSILLFYAIRLGA